MTEVGENNFYPQEIFVLSYKDPQLAGTREMNRQRGKWLVVGLDDGFNSPIQWYENKGKAVKKARKAAKKSAKKNSRDVRLEIKNLDGSTSEVSNY